MPTDNERREVARRLRRLNGNISHVRRVYEAEGIYTFCDDQADYYQICYAIAGYLPAEHMHPCDYEELHDRLADLIEPFGHECVPGECPLNVRHDLDHIDRERLLAIATTMAADSVRSVKQGDSVSPVYILHAARDIAEACGETFGSIRNRELAEWGTSIVPKETIVDRDGLLTVAETMDQDAFLYREAAKSFTECGNHDAAEICYEAAGEYNGYAKVIREALGASE